MNDKGVYRTAPARPGLLMIYCLLAWTKNPKFLVCGLPNMANTAYGHKVTESFLFFIFLHVLLAYDHTQCSPY